MFIKNSIEFKTDSGTEYIYCSDTCMVFEKSEFGNESISKDRYEKWKLLYDEFKNQELNRDRIKFKDVTQLKEHLYRNGFYQLTLEVTSSCNLRCNYCIFSGNYEDRRTHGTEKMNKEIAFKAIKMYYNYYSEAKKHNPYAKPTIGFYGGEPLLNIDLIKDCLKYIRTIFSEEDNLYLTITTNGTLLTDEIIKLFNEENVNIVLSLDGPKEVQDKNRVFINKKGTFDIVRENAKSISKITKRPVIVNSVYDYNTNLEDVFNFFDENKDILNINISPVSSFETDYYKQFDRETIENFVNKYKQLTDKFKKCISDLDVYNQNHTPKFITQFFGRKCGSLLMKQALSPRKAPVHYTGACVPGEKIFVDIEGKLYICEKVDKSLTIGDVDNGLDFQRILEILKEYNECCVECRNCPVHNQCSLCYASLNNNGAFIKNNDNCKSIINTFKERLSLTYSVLEKNPEWFIGFLDNYYGKLRELDVCQKC